MSANFTPGPWLARPEIQRQDWEPFNNGGAVEIGPKQIHGMTCADARLIAAAPELLEALKALCDAAALGECVKDSEGRECSALIEARAAIAKAEGRAE